MKKIILIGALVGLLAGYVEDIGVTFKQEGNNRGDRPLYVLQVNGEPIECLWVGQSMTCNWEKHNKLFEGGISQ